MYRNVKKELRAQASALVPAYSPEFYRSKLPQGSNTFIEKRGHTKLVPILLSSLVVGLVIAFMSNIFNKEFLSIKTTTQLPTATTTIQAVESIVQDTASANGTETTASTKTEQAVVSETIPVAATDFWDGNEDWSAKEIFNRFPNIDYAGITYEAANWIDASTDPPITTQESEYIIGSAIAIAVDSQTAKQYTVGVNLYKLKFIDQACAVGVKFDGDVNIYAYLSLNYNPVTLGAMMDIIDFRNTVKFTDAIYGNQIYNVNADEIYSLLLNNRNASLTEDMFYTELLTIHAECPALGRYHCVITLTKEGYVFINIFGGYFFYVGTNAITEYLNTLSITVDTNTFNNSGNDTNGIIAGKAFIPAS